MLIQLQLLDCLLTLDVEIQYAWNGPWNLGRILFFLTRYPAILEIPVNMYCEYYLPSRDIGLNQ